MKSVQLPLAGLFILLQAGATSVPRPAPLFTFHHENVLGTSLQIKIGAASRADAQRAEAAALAEIDRLAKILSSYDKQSEFSRWARTRGQAVPVSPELFEVLSLFDTWRQRTGGALDASAEAVNRVWKAAAVRNTLPTAAELNTVTAAVRQTHWRLDAAARTATHLTDTPLALNSFTKSYIAARAQRAALDAARLSALVINIGGDLLVSGTHAEPVRLADPRADAENAAPLATLSVQDRAVATSGSYRRGVDINGRHYSHIIDPRTGQPAGHIISSTVVAANAADAGALATAFSVLDPRESTRLASSMPGVEFLLVKNDGSRVTSRGWRTLELPAVQAASAVWNAGFELIVNFELARIDDMRYRRPFVAVWIEDKDRFPLRTLALWFDRDRWIPDLKSWYRGDRLRAMAEGTEIQNTVSSATRPPGKYSVKWDGKDQKGNLVPRGKYTVCIEAAREHGTYQIIRQEMEFGAAPKQLDLTGGVEIAGASLDYRRTPR